MKYEKRMNEKRRSEVVVVEKEHEEPKRVGSIFMTKWSFKKNRIYRDADGEVTCEQPFDEIAFSLGKLRFGKWSNMWLSPDDVRDLANVIEVQQKLG